MKHLEDGLHRLVSGVGSLLVSILDVSVVPVTATRHTNETAPTKRLLSQRRSAHSDRKTQVASPRGRPKACLNLPNLSLDIKQGGHHIINIDDLCGEGDLSH